MNDRGFDQGRRDNGSQMVVGRREERDTEYDMQRERAMQGGQGRGWNEPRDDERHMSERQSFGRDERQRWSRDEYPGYGRDERWDCEHDLRRHKLGFGGTDSSFQGAGYGNQGYGFGPPGAGYGNQGYSFGPQGGYGNQGGYGFGPQGGYGFGPQGGGFGNPGFQGGGFGYQDRFGGYGNPYRFGGLDYSRFGGGYGQNEARGAWGGYGTPVGMWNQASGMMRGNEPQPRGHAPKSYQRSDERIKEDICDRLMHSYIDAENVDVEVRSGEVTLTGTVEHRGAKRDIEDLAEQILGVREVQNQLRVSRQDEPHSPSRTTTSGTTASKKPTA